MLRRQRLRLDSVLRNGSLVGVMGAPQEERPSVDRGHQLHHNVVEGNSGIVVHDVSDVDERIWAQREGISEGEGMYVVTEHPDCGGFSMAYSSVRHKR